VRAFYLSKSCVESSSSIPFFCVVVPFTRQSRILQCLLLRTSMKSSQHWVVQDLHRQAKSCLGPFPSGGPSLTPQLKGYETVFRAVSVQRSQYCGHETPSMSGIYQAVPYISDICRHVRLSDREFQNIHLSCLLTLAPEDQSVWDILAT
jgi:hypothetical protein